jgi:hypothetical protein
MTGEVPGWQDKASTRATEAGWPGHDGGETWIAPGKTITAEEKAVRRIDPSRP